jgi:hypothetical protein
MSDVSGDQTDIMDIVHDIAPDYRPHHTTAAFWQGVDDARWNRATGVVGLARRAGISAFYRASELIGGTED